MGWRLGVCILLLFWILHLIFTNEAQQGSILHGRVWTELSRVEQWRAAWTIGPPELLRALTQVTPRGLGLSVILWGATIVLGAVRWHIVLRAGGLDLGMRRTLQISFVAHFFNSFLLGSTGGDLLKAYYAARETRHKKIEAVVTVYVDRLIGLFAMLLFATLLMIPNLQLLSTQSRLLGVAAIVGLMLAACTLVMCLSFWGGVSRGIPRAREWLQGLPQSEVVERSLDACRSFGGKPGLLLQSLLLSMVLNVVCVLQMLVLARGMHLPTPVLAMFLIVPMVICISALPITPSGLGVRENLYVITLGVPAVGVGPTEALSLSLLAYACSLFWSLIGAGLYLGMRESQRLADFASEDKARAA